MAACGSGLYGCEHYRRRCMIRAPCCNKIFYCRHCHNEIADHVLPRHDVEYVICLNCEAEQQIGKMCLNCGIALGKYFCVICKFYDDDVSKGQFHCEKCGICRVGGEDKFYHCDKCGCCISLDLISNHVCIEDSLKHDCALCFEHLFDTLKPITVLACGHTMHADCLKEMKEKLQFACPICNVKL